MSKNKIIDLYCFGREIGRIGLDEDAHKSFFQYNPEFLKSGNYPHMFPVVLKRIKQTQVFGQFNNESFRGLPPMFADSLPDAFGNMIFKTWLESKNKTFNRISALEQLTYVANRGMGALEYRPATTLPKGSTIDIKAIVDVLKQVLEQKQQTRESKFNNSALLNIFKIGTSAGGVRPKILISENKKTKEIIPGDIEYSDEFLHYLVKLNVDDEKDYPKEKMEYSFYLSAIDCGIRMMDSKLIENRHFATLRFDRQNGTKQHTLTASGISGWDYKDTDVSSYENLFKLANFLKLPYKEIDELYTRMVFNLVFCNYDDHLKNHAFIYDRENDHWHLSPAYDLTYSLNPLLNFTKTSRVLSINSKRTDITLDDLLKIADQFTIKNPKNKIEMVQDAVTLWLRHAKNLDIPERMAEKIRSEFHTFL